MKKSIFSQLYIQHRFNCEGLAVQAAVPMAVIDRMLLSQPVSRTVAERVLAVLSLRTGQSYSLNNVAITLLSDEKQAR